jgi:hypothetical protein
MDGQDTMICVISRYFCGRRSLTTEAHERTEKATGSQWDEY